MIPVWEIMCNTWYDVSLWDLVTHTSYSLVIVRSSYGITLLIFSSIGIIYYVGEVPRFNAVCDLLFCYFNFIGWTPCMCNVITGVLYVHGFPYLCHVSWYRFSSWPWSFSMMWLSVKSLPVPRILTRLYYGSVPSMVFSFISIVVDLIASECLEVCKLTESGINWVTRTLDSNHRHKRT